MQAQPKTPGAYSGDPEGKAVPTFLKTSPSLHILKYVNLNTL